MTRAGWRALRALALGPARVGWRAALQLFVRGLALPTLARGLAPPAMRLTPRGLAALLRAREVSGGLDTRRLLRAPPRLAPGPWPRPSEAPARSAPPPPSGPPGGPPEPGGQGGEPAGEGPVVEVYTEADEGGP